MLCVAVWRICWICIASYALGNQWYMKVAWKPLLMLAPLSLVQRCLYLHSVHFIPCCTCIYAESYAAYELSVIKSFFHFYIAGILGVNVPHAVCFFCKVNFCKKWLNDCLSCFYLFFYHEVCYVYYQVMENKVLLKVYFTSSVFHCHLLWDNRCIHIMNCLPKQR